MSGRLPLVLEHGWAYDRTVWEPLRAELAGWPVAAKDAGYFGAPNAEPLPDAFVAVGHSLGAMRSLADHDGRCRALVLINGFSRFTAAADFPAGVAPRLVERMLARLERDPAAVVADFRVRCGGTAPGPASAFDAAALAAGLETLRDGDARAALAVTRVPMLVLAGDADPIVPAALTLASFEASPAGIAWREGGGHLLPLTDAAWCADRIRAFVGALPER